MSRVVVEMATGNAAFRLSEGGLDRDEVRLVLEEAAAKILEGRDSGALFDSNGNSVGTYTVEEDR